MLSDINYIELQTFRSIQSMDGYTLTSQSVHNGITSYRFEVPCKPVDKIIVWTMLEKLIGNIKPARIHGKKDVLYVVYR